MELPARCHVHISTRIWEPKLSEPAATAVSTEERRTYSKFYSFAGDNGQRSYSSTSSSTNEKRLNT
ncbi:hypothetical protein DPMN_189376 [Dreissena polymorpha]|uniref:Uncharacterized protein n=1 Tax=Dreissena polymorpha TaxID=45954 RepID=A0A9D4DU81_DREPO|nr:hypothetical protein DPMN_189376 [Dreissena polymorpha]